MSEISNPGRIAVGSVAEDAARLENPRNLLKSLRQLVRYAATCGLVLSAKLLLIWVLVQWLNAPLAYFIVHVVIFFVSYVLHSAVSFKVSFSWSNLRRYFAAVAMFKLLDFAIFNLLFAAFSVTETWCVLASSLIDLILRFLVTRRVLHPSCSASGGRD